MNNLKAYRQTISPYYFTQIKLPTGKIVIQTSDSSTFNISDSRDSLKYFGIKPCSYHDENGFVILSPNIFNLHVKEWQYYLFKGTTHTYLEWMVLSGGQR